MAINTGSSKFRKVDVDQFCEDNFHDDLADAPVGERPPSAIVDNETFVKLEALQEEINSLLAAGHLVQSLQLVLRDPPVKCKDQLLKDMALK